MEDLLDDLVDHQGTLDTPVLHKRQVVRVVLDIQIQDAYSAALDREQMMPVGALGDGGEVLERPLSVL